MKTASQAAALLALVSSVGSASAFLGGGGTSISRSAKTATRTAARSSLMAMPLELAENLDESKQWEVELELDGVTEKVTIPEGTSVLEAAKMVFDDPPRSCENGVCTNCAGLVNAGTQGDNYRVGITMLAPEQGEKGFTLTCQTYPCGPGLKVLLNQYETVYGMQYGVHEVERDEREKKKKKLFGIL